MKKALLETGETTHEEIQWLLLKLSAPIWAWMSGGQERPERKAQRSQFPVYSSLSRELPRQFDDATNRTIELIDVFWPQGDAIITAFKAEHTKTIYSELLRMSDQSECSSDIKITCS